MSGMRLKNIWFTMPTCTTTGNIRDIYNRQAGEFIKAVTAAQAYFTLTRIQATLQVMDCQAWLFSPTFIR